MMYELSVRALWQPVRQYALQQAFLIVSGAQCEDKQRPVFRQEEVTSNISSDMCIVCSSWHYRRIQCNSATVLGVSDCTNVTKRSENCVKLHYCVTCNLNTCVTIVPNVLQFIAAIGTCRGALSKYTLGQLCNHTFLDPFCHTPFFISLYKESIPEVLPLSFHTPVFKDMCITAMQMQQQLSEYMKYSTNSNV
jgi:hypothetical protein